MEKNKIAKIVNTHALKGQLKILPLVDNNEIFKNLKKFEISGFVDQFECEKITPIKDLYLLKMAGYDDINMVEGFKGHDIFVEQSDLQLNQGQYFVSDLLNSQLIFNDNVIGNIIRVENFGASDVFTFVDENGEHLVPFVDYFFDKIDIDDKKIIVNEHFFEGVL